ncbi:hypothetical protein GQ600_9265 [Phytophthora cactorum]|nr:hypothetical protein GQ600_9265 [Phytophthora cactorum]
MHFCKSEDDPFQNDYLTRLLEMLPPYSSDNRMSRASMDYMVSVLVVLSIKLVGHTNSCFKQSRVTADASCCRYSFPRERIEATTFTSSGVQLKRLVAHEFINGYNYVIMATFKCNHGIQLLLGGKDATERTFYCCKYVTKQQKQIDSTVAVALAALKRREEKEKTELKSRHN